MNVIFLDFQKAFDKVPHERLLLKVKGMGIGSQVANWMSRGLVIGNKGLLLMVNVLFGQKLVVECPRARSWGLILFVIFINDIENGTCGNILKFADDTKLFCKVGSDINCAKLRADIRKLYNWSED